MTDWTVLANGLGFPEGPVWCPDGSVLLVEIEHGRIARIHPDGRTSIAVETGGGPNGLAMGPDGMLYACQNGGCLWREWNGMRLPHGIPDAYPGGSIQRVNLSTGAVEDVYTHDGAVPLWGPNDLVFDQHGGFWFTDNGKSNGREKKVTGVFYAKADGSACHEVIFPLDGPNGVGLSPDGNTLYVSETPSARLWAFDVAAPGEVELKPGLRGPSGRLVYGAPGVSGFDSLAVEACGNICVATIGLPGRCGITVVSPDGDLIDFVPTDDCFTTNIAFGGEDLMTAFVTLGGTGRLVSRAWPRAGLALT
jgi:gluconolactonase